MENIITLLNLNKNVVTKEGESKAVLEDINLAVNAGEFVCIMGPSGCGKSVLLSIMGGIEKASDGMFLFEGNDCMRHMTKEQKKKIGYVFQQDNLLAWRSVYKNVRLPLEVGKARENEREKIMDALSMVGLENYAECYPKELSGGMRQRAAIARALVKDANVLMLDQPFGALDAITRKTLGYKLLQIWNETRKTMVMLTNGVEEALLLANKIYIMSSLPGHFLYEIKVPFTYEERMSDLSKDSRYIKLKEELEGYVK